MKKTSSKTLAIWGAVFCVLFLPAGVVLLILALRRYREEVYDVNVAKREAEEAARRSAALEAAHASAMKAQAEAEARRGSRSSRSSDGSYEYSGVAVCILQGTDPDLSDVAAGDDVELVLEEENENDPEAVAVYIGGQRVGYLYRGKLKAMVVDFLRRGDDVSAEVATVSGASVTIDMALSKL